MSEKRTVFRDLHRQGCFVIPNPWDVGSARYLQSLGFKALATTSSGLAWSNGMRDGAMALGGVLCHLRAMAAATQIPISADFENGYGVTPDDVQNHVGEAVSTGIAGLSIEDATGNRADPLFDIATAVTRLKAARAAIDAHGGDALLTGRAEGFIVGRPDLEDVVARLKAYAAAGADCLYAPGITTETQVAAIVQAVAPKPVNVLVGSPSFTVEQLAKLGVRRISVGGALARTAWGAFMNAAQEIATSGTFGAFGKAAPGRDLNGLMTDKA